MTILKMRDAASLFSFVAIAAMASGCQLSRDGAKAILGKAASASGSSKVRVNLGKTTTTSFIQSNLSIPATLSEFNCFAINVTGPGIKTVDACGGSSKMGTVIGFLPKGSIIDIDVPLGVSRNFEVWGFAATSPGICPDVVDLLNLPRGAIPGRAKSTGFILGSKRADILNRSTTIDIDVSYSVATATSFCGQDLNVDTTIDYVKETPGAAGSVAVTNGGSTANLTTYCIGFKTNVANPNFTLSLDGVSTTVNQGGCNTYTDGYVHEYTPGIAGTHTISIATTDSITLRADTTPPQFSFTIDNTGPTLTLNSFTPGGLNAGIYYSNVLNPIAQMTTDEAATVTFSSGAPQTCAVVSSARNFNCQATPALGAPGAYAITIDGTDALGNSAADVNVNLVIDQTAPTITLTSDGWLMGGALTGATFLTANDTVPGVVNTATFSCSMDSATATSCTNPYTVTSGGRHTLTSTVKDYATNTTNSNGYFYIDSLTNQTVLGRLDESLNSVSDESYLSFSPSNLPAATGLNNPTSIAIDTSSNYVYVADTGNVRVLVYKWDSVNKRFASRKAVAVYGQPNFIATEAGIANTTVNGVTYTPFNSVYGVDISTTSPKKLFVADTGNNRVLRFDISTAPYGDGLTITTGNYNRVAEVVFGQSTFNTNTANIDGNTSDTSVNMANGLYNPVRLHIEGTRLFVSDLANCRAVVYNNATTTITNGDNIVTQLNAAGTAIGGNYLCPSAAVAQNVMAAPVGITVDPTTDTLYITDFQYARILSWPSASTMVGSQTATGVIGQADFVTAVPTDAANYTAAPNLTATAGIDVATIGASRFLIVAQGNKVKFINPTTGLTHYSLNSNGNTGTSETQFNSIFDVVYNDISSSLLFVEQSNHRVSSLPITTLSDNLPITDLLGHTDSTGTLKTFVSKESNAPNDATLNAPTNAVADLDHLRLYVSDTGNHRILVYPLNPITYKPNKTATAVLGIPPSPSNGNVFLDSKTTVVSPSAYTLRSPRGLALDSSGNLFVADTSNNRVLRFPTSSFTISSALNADLVLGQSDFISSTTAVFNQPTGVAFDTLTNTLYVSDAANHRVAYYSNASSLTSGAAITGNIGTSGMSGTSDILLNTPMGIDITTGAGSIPHGLFVTDNGNHRVLYFDFTSVTPTQAAMCYGHYGANLAASCALSAANDSSVTPLNYSFNSPRSVKFDPSTQKLFVSDTGNSRVLYFDLSSSVNIPSIAGVTNSHAASHAVGAADLVTIGSGNAVNMAYPQYVKTPEGIIYLDAPSTSSNLLYIIDQSWNRVGVYESP